MRLRNVEAPVTGTDKCADTIPNSKDTNLRFTRAVFSVSNLGHLH